MSDVVSLLKEVIKSKVKIKEELEDEYWNVDVSNRFVS